MTLSDKAVQEFKEIYKKKYGKELSDAKAQEYGEQVLGLARIFLEQAKIEVRRKKRLEKEPEGFHLEEDEGPYNCRVCYQLVGGSDAWWDLNGVKCLDCQRNIKEGVIPAEICKNDDLWIKEWQLKSDYNLHPSTRGKLRREGILKGRDLKTKDGTIYFTAYLVGENREFLKKYPKKPAMKMEFISSSDKRRKKK